MFQFTGNCRSITMLRSVLICVFSVSCVLSMTTTKAPHHHHGTGTHLPHSPKPSQEPGEYEYFKFIYESHSHMMVVVNGHDSCYVFTLTDSERSSIHTDAGIRAVELKLLGSLSTAPVAEVTKDQLHNKTAHACGKVQHYYKETVV